MIWDAEKVGLIQPSFFGLWAAPLGVFAFGLVFFGLAYFAYVASRSPE